MISIYDAIIHDWFNLRKTLKPFKLKKWHYLLATLSFYHFISFMFGQFSIRFDPIYFPTGLPDFGFHPSIINSLFLSPLFEEIVFFGLPWYLFSNNIFVLVLGSIWAIIHLLIDTTSNGTGYLDVTTFLASIPVLIFSYKAWVSGLGWLSIVTHLGWNIASYFFNCELGVSCQNFIIENEFGFPEFPLMFGLVLVLSITTFSLCMFWKRPQNSIDNFKSK